MKFYVTVGRLIRQECVVCVEADNEDQIHDNIDQVHDEADCNGDWEEDNEYGYEPSAHVGIEAVPVRDREDFQSDVDLCDESEEEDSEE